MYLSNLYVSDRLNGARRSQSGTFQKTRPNAEIEISVWSGNGARLNYPSGANPNGATGPNY